MKDIRWMLPDGVEEVLPPQTRAMEKLRRELIDLMDRWGYELAIPPLVEYLDGLLSGSGSDLDPHTIKFVDQISGRLLGIRADMTTQVARMDAHQLKQDGVTRLCYLGPVLKAVPPQAGASRNPLQVGAELYGHDGTESEIEVLMLMLAVMKAAAVEDVLIDVGHVGVFRTLAKAAGLDYDDECRLFDMMQRKAVADIEAFVAGAALPESIAAAVKALPRLNGDATVINSARELFAGIDEDLDAELDELAAFVSAASEMNPDLALHVDLAELRGYAYHTGVVFAAFVPGVGQEVARGGRYNHVGEYFGRARAATGFSADLKTLLNLGQEIVAERAGAISAPWSLDRDLVRTINDLRDQGECVIQQVDGERDPSCDRQLIHEDGQWLVKPLV